MRKRIQIKVRPDRRDDHDDVIRRALAGRDPDQTQARILRRSLDARKKDIWYVFQVEVWSADEEIPVGIESPDYQDVSDRIAVHIIGAGPAGYFACP